MLGLAGVAAAQWLAVRLQLLAAVLVAAVALLAVLGRAGLLPWTSAHSDRCAHALTLSYTQGLRPCWGAPHLHGRLDSSAPCLPASGVEALLGSPARAWADWVPRLCISRP